jgi:hypothetical protein
MSRSQPNLAPSPTRRARSYTPLSRGVPDCRLHHHQVTDLAAKIESNVAKEYSAHSFIVDFLTIKVGGTTVVTLYFTLSAKMFANVFMKFDLVEPGRARRVETHAHLCVCRAAPRTGADAGADRAAVCRGLPDHPRCDSDGRGRARAGRPRWQQPRGVRA